MTIAATGWSSSNPSGFAFNNSGDQLFAFQSTSTVNQANWGTQTGITLLFGLNYGIALTTSGVVSASTTYQPSTSLLPNIAFLNLPRRSLKRIIRSFYS